jgi:hypothetical protein
VREEREKAEREEDRTNKHNIPKRNAQNKKKLYHVLSKEEMFHFIKTQTPRNFLF